MSNSKAIPAGDIKFYNRHIPPLEAGDYLISTKQIVSKTSGVEGGQELPETQFPEGMPLTQAFSISAPRFNLDPGEVQAMFPPSGHLGAFDQNLPSITLKGEALPWERQMNVGAEDDGTPYMALILLREDELAKPLTTYRASQILDPGPGVLAPQIIPEYQDKLDEVSGAQVTSGGSGYTTATVSLTGGGGQDATATAHITNGVVSSVEMSDNGSGYSTAPAISVTSTAGSGFAGTAVLQNGEVTSVAIKAAGQGYKSGDVLKFSGGAGSGAAASVLVTDGMISGISIDTPGQGYDSDPVVTITGDGQGAIATSARGVTGRAIDLTTAQFAALMPRYDSSEQSEPKWLTHVRGVPVLDKDEAMVVGETDFAVVVGNRFPTPGPGPVSALTVEGGGAGYTSTPIVSFSDDAGGTGAQAVAVLNETGQVEDVVILNGGTGYIRPPTVTISGGGATQDASAVAQTSARWQVHLVSLEGYRDFLGETPSWVDPKTKNAVSSVRLVSFFNWSFDCLSDFGNFKDLMENMAAPAQKGADKDALLLRLPLPGEGDGSDEAKDVNAAFAKGYTALEYQTRAGVNTFAWYRGPLTPLPVPLFDAPSWDTAAASMIYDDKTGLFDQSYSAGWQAGRMLALSDQKFGQQLRAWRRNGIKLANLLLERLSNPATAALRSKLTPEHLATTGADVVAELEILIEPYLFSDGVMDYLTGHFQASIAPYVGQMDLPAHGTGDHNQKMADPNLPANEVKALKDLLELPAVQELLRKMNGTALGAAGPSPMSYVVEWLGRLRLMEGVPFVQMVPDVRALPQESLRFFYLDPNYQKALVDGALSIGIENSKEVLYQKLNYDLIQDATQQEMRQTRAKMMGIDVVNPQADPGVPMVGCLMRSAVVAGWPGLEVKAFATSTYCSDSETGPSNSDGKTSPSDPMNAMRIVRLAPELLFCLFPEPPAWVQFGEPKEQLAFGYEDGGDIDLRWISPDKEGGMGSIISPKVPVSINKYWRGGDASARVLDVFGLAAALKNGLTTAYGGALPAGYDSADFAIQMVRAPEQMIFQNLAAPKSEE